MQYNTSLAYPTASAPPGPVFLPTTTTTSSSLACVPNPAQDLGFVGPTPYYPPPSTLPPCPPQPGRAVKPDSHVAVEYKPLAATVGAPASPTSRYRTRYHPRVFTEDAACAFFVLMLGIFLIPPLLIFNLCFWNSPDRSARVWAKISLIVGVLYLLVVIIVVIILSVCSSW
eukprot:RCo006040